MLISVLAIACLLMSGIKCQSNSNGYGNSNQYDQPNGNGNSNQYGQPNGNGNSNQYGQPNGYGNSNQYGQANPNGYNSNQYSQPNSNGYGNSNQYGQPNSNGYNQNPNGNQGYGMQNQYGGNQPNNMGSQGRRGGQGMMGQGMMGQGMMGMMPQCALNGAMYDMVFIIDETTTMARAATDIYLAANMTMAFNNVGPQGIQVGLITITNQPQVIFTLNQHTNKMDACQAIEAQLPMQDMSSMSPNLASAMNLALTREYTNAGGMRGNTPNVIVLISDGNDNSNVAAAYQQAQQAQTNVFAIYTGNASMQLSAQKNQQALQQMNAASGGNVIVASNYRSIPALITAACQTIASAEQTISNQQVYGNNIGGQQSNNNYNNNMNNNYG